MASTSSAPATTALKRLPRRRLQIPSIPTPKRPAAPNNYTLPTAIARVAAFLTGGKGGGEEARGGTLVITGAGVSVESGIRAYRGKQGHYELHKKYRPIFYHEFAEESKEGFRFRQRYWARSFFGYAPVQRAQPNRTHFSIAALQHLGLVDGLITQNVDRLHHKATPSALSPDSTILELHGTLHYVHVPSHPTYPRLLRSTFQSQLASLNPAWADFLASRTTFKTNPDGDVELPGGLNYAAFQFPEPEGLRGQSGAWWKPDVVFFGQSLSEEQKGRSIEMVDQAERVLVVGSSLATYSAFRLVKQAVESKKPVLLLNVGPTRADDLDGAEKVEWGAGEVLRGVVDLLAKEKGGPRDAELERLRTSGVLISVEEMERGGGMGAEATPH